jgi:energy-coupling factor transporter ATP-binding protein EcfA2
MTTLIDISGLQFCYGAVEALAGVDLRIDEGESVAVVGANGSGKSTLARLLGGLERPGAATTAVACAHDLLTHEGRLAARRDVGVLFQDPENQFVGANVEEDLAFGLENLAWPAERIAARVAEVVETFGLRDLLERPPQSLSGGQKQRTALAGVLAVPRRVLVLDEPTSMLDPAGRDDVLKAVRRLHAGGLTVVYVTQEMDEVAEAGRVVALQAGRVAFDGPPTGLFADVELVEQLSLGLPMPAAVAAELARRGRRLAGLPFSLEALVAELKAGGLS